jgi:hypothetical protein
MSSEHFKLLACRTKSIPAVIGMGFCLTFAAAEQSLAVDCVNDPSKAWVTTAKDPAPSDDRAIRNLISTYNWALDSHLPSQLEGLFADNVFYELCNAAGEQLVQTTDDEQLTIYLNEYFKGFVKRGTQSRHIESNTLLYMIDDRNVQGKTTVAVTLQHPDIETPVLDYTGVLRTTFTKVGDTWLFSKITVITDGPRLELRAR